MQNSSDTIQKHEKIFTIVKMHTVLYVCVQRVEQYFANAPCWKNSQLYFTYSPCFPYWLKTVRGLRILAFANVCLFAKVAKWCPVKFSTHTYETCTVETNTHDTWLTLQTSCFHSRNWPIDNPSIWTHWLLCSREHSLSSLPPQLSHRGMLHSVCSAVKYWYGQLHHTLHNQ